LVFKVLSEKFGNHDLSGLKLRSYENLLIPGPTIAHRWVANSDHSTVSIAHRQILLNVSLSSDMGNFFRIKPSTMTDFEFGVLCFCANNKYESQSTKAILELCEHVIERQPSDIDPRQINVVYSVLQKMGVTGASCPYSKNKKKSGITIFSLLGINKTRAIPKNWEMKEMASYILSAGDFPTPGRARQIAGQRNRPFS
jgi:hypothetical protein